MSRLISVFMAEPSFLVGWARTLDLFATLSGHSYRYPASGQEADAIAIRSDWQAVGDDLWDAMNEHSENVETEAA